MTRKQLDALRRRMLVARIKATGATVYMQTLRRIAASVK